MCNSADLHSADLKRDFNNFIWKLVFDIKTELKSETFTYCRAEWRKTADVMIPSQMLIG